jgi:hypothetical protein
LINHKLLKLVCRLHKYVNKDNNKFDLIIQQMLLFRVDFTAIGEITTILVIQSLLMLREFKTRSLQLRLWGIIPIEYNDYDDELIIDMINNEQKYIQLSSITRSSDHEFFPKQSILPKNTK